MKKMSTAILVSLGIGSFALALPPTADQLQAGGSIALELTGKPADAYLRLLKQPVPDDATIDYGVPLDARITAVRQGQVQTISIVAVETENGNTLITVEVSLPVASITRPTGYFQPRSPNPTPLEQQVQEVSDRRAQLPQAKVAQLDGIRLRRWSLTEEITQ